MGCMKLLYSTLMACYLGTGFNTKECNDPEKHFRPIYEMYDCGYCSKDVDLMIQLQNMLEPTDMECK